MILQIRLGRSPMFDRLTPAEPDALVAITAACRADPRPDKIDLGIGVYRDGAGRCPVMDSVKIAEDRLLRTQESKSYVGQLGDPEFGELLAIEVLGADRFSDNRDCLVTAQAPGGTGALRLAAELVRSGDPHPVAWVGSPTWPAHEPLLRAVGFEVRDFVYATSNTRELDFASILSALNRARAGSVVVLQGCCHNPTGIDWRPEHWLRIADLCTKRRLIPLVDFAYMGLGEGLAEDARGVRLLIDRLPQALLAVSCSKAFGLYRERTGLLIVKCARPDADKVRAQLTNLARLLWSMPPDHGAAVVKTILTDSQLAAAWRDEVSGMRERLLAVRATLVKAGDGVNLDYRALLSQRGLFTVFALDPHQLSALRKEHGVYLADNGRANLAGLNEGNMDRFVQAMASAAPPP